MLYDLVAFEVYVDLSKLDSPPQSAAGSAHSEHAQQHKTPPSTSSGSRLPKFLPNPKLYQVLGTFCSYAEKQPPNLDLGLFDWEYFADFDTRHAIAPVRSEGPDADSVSVISSTRSLTTAESSGKLSVGSPNRKDAPSVTSASASAPRTSVETPERVSRNINRWMPSIPHSGKSIGITVRRHYNPYFAGISSFETISSQGVPFQFRLVCANAEQTYLSEAVPRKIRSWIGIP